MSTVGMQPARVVEQPDDPDVLVRPRIADRVEERAAACRRRSSGGARRRGRPARARGRCEARRRPRRRSPTLRHEECGRDRGDQAPVVEAVGVDERERHCPQDERNARHRRSGTGPDAGRARVRRIRSERSGPDRPCSGTDTRRRRTQATSEHRRDGTRLPPLQREHDVGDDASTTSMLTHHHARSVVRPGHEAGRSRRRTRRAR